MNNLFESVTSVFSFIIPISDFLWDFPTNFNWYKAIPVLGNFSLAVIVLVGSGIFFTFKLSFVQVRYFKRGIKILAERKKTSVGISQLTSFLLSTAMRVGPGNIIGVTGAIAVGGPGAMFWIWVSAFFGMATAFLEGTLAQIFKEKNGDEFVGGLPYYGRKLVKNSIIVGIFLSILYIIYALCCLPAQGFNTVSAVSSIASFITNEEVSTTFNMIVGAIVILLTIIIAFGGIKKVTKVTDKMVPIMSVLYCITVLLIIIFNIDKLPFFFREVFVGAFKPQAVFGGAFGVAFAQGVKRGLMSNEAGQGTITMPAASAYTKYPVEQGFVSSLGVFLDTPIICTATGFVVVMANCYGNSEYVNEFFNLDKLSQYLLSIEVLTVPFLQTFVKIIISICFGLFAYTCLLGMISFSEIAATRITKNKIFINVIRVLCLLVATFGLVCQILNINLSNLWAISDLGNILIVYFNIPLLYLGFKYVKRALNAYENDRTVKFTSKTIQFDKLDYWDNE